MNKYLLIIISLLYSCLTFAGSNYQVDLVLFSHPHNANKNNNLNPDSPMLPISKNAIILTPNAAHSNKPYHLLSASRSSLRDPYYLLNRKHIYQILGHYSWIQPNKSQSTVALPLVNRNGWQIQGTVRVRQANYYMFDAQFQLSPPSNPESTFTVIQKQRIKGGTVYYLDHPQLGMLVKIHRVA